MPTAPATQALVKTPEKAYPGLYLPAAADVRQQALRRPIANTSQIARLLDGGMPLGDRTSSSRRLSAIPGCAGLMTRLACAYARRGGLDLQPVLKRVGLTVRDIEDESVPLGVTTQIACLNSLARALDDRLLGFHVAQTMDLRRTGFLYYVAASSDNLGDALQRIARFSGIVNEGVALATDFGDELRVHFSYAGVSRPSDRHQIEAWIVALFRCCREITGREIQPTGIRIMHQRIPESAEIDSFFGRRVEFGAADDELCFARDAAKLPVVNADRHLNRLLIAHCESVLARRSPRSGTLRADVENAIAASLPHGQTHIETVAQKLGVSSRTLRRKLAAEDLTFAGILDDLRFSLARHYLAERDLSISRIAWLLGYTEVSAFSHAFRRWAGRPPRADRSRHRPGPMPAPAKRRMRGMRPG